MKYQWSCEKLPPTVYVKQMSVWYYNTPIIIILPPLVGNCDQADDMPWLWPCCDQVLDWNVQWTRSWLRHRVTSDISSQSQQNKCLNCLSVVSKLFLLHNSFWFGVGSQNQRVIHSQTWDGFNGSMLSHCVTCLGSRCKTNVYMKHAQ